MIKVFVQGVSVLAPGLPNWEQSKPVLRGDTPYHVGPLPSFNTELLPATERRRSSEVVRWAITAAQEALTMSGLSGEHATVFASSDGDGQVINQICETLASCEPIISPTRFQNSVHNVAAGYWSIINHSHQASNSLAAYGGSFAAGLLEAAAQAVVENQPVLLVAFDLPYPEPLSQLRQIGYGFAAALVLAPTAEKNSLLKLEIEFSAQPAPSVKSSIPELLNDNPAAQSWPLLEALAQRNQSTIYLPYTETDHLAIKCGNIV
jgi:hypothetical protein